MAELKATVCLQGKDIEVISSHIEFNRKTDNKGRPVTNVIGGRITITVESTRGVSETLNFSLHGSHRQICGLFPLCESPPHRLSDY